MNFKTEQNSLTIYLEGRIDSNSVEGVSKEVDEICNSHFDKSVSDFGLVIDVEKLLYISSAGLRMILKLLKDFVNVSVINASSEVYDILEMTGFTEMLSVSKAYRQLSVDGCDVIGQGAKGIVYRYDKETIVKVYKNSDCLPDIKRERELARRAFVLGVPTAISYDIVKVGENYGSMFELLDAKSYSQLIISDPANRDKYISEFALLLKKIHGTPVKPEDMPNISEVVNKRLKATLRWLNKEDGDKLVKLLDNTPTVINMIHGDYHTNNVLSQNGEALLIDMDTLSYGHPVHELGSIYVCYWCFTEEYPESSRAFLSMSKEEANYVWKKFLQVYLDTTDEARLAEVEDKVKVASYMRMIHHADRRNEQETENGRKMIEKYAERLSQLVNKLDTLDF